MGGRVLWIGSGREGGRTNAEYKGYVADAAFRGGDTVDGLEVDGKVVEEGEERAGEAAYCALVLRVCV